MSEIIIREAIVTDVYVLTSLCAEHAAYEKADFDEAGHAERLKSAMNEIHPRLIAYLAEQTSDAVGFIAFSEQFSTWQARNYIHMYCLYVIEPMRGQGIGRRLIEFATAAAQKHGFLEMQWQTPKWNTEAIRFYRSLGAIEKEKSRFSLAIPAKRK